jgi:hypothetical protein
MEETYIGGPSNQTLLALTRLRLYKQSHAADFVSIVTPARHPNLGPRGGFTHPRLHEWRFFLVSPPFNQHILFYELAGGDIVMRRTMRGQRDLPRRLLEAPGAE